MYNTLLQLWGFRDVSKRRVRKACQEGRARKACRKGESRKARRRVRNGIKPGHQNQQHRQTDHPGRLCCWWCDWSGARGGWACDSNVARFPVTPIRSSKKDPRSQSGGLSPSCRGLHLSMLMLAEHILCAAWRIDFCS